MAAITMRHGAERALRDMASGHLSVFRSASGEDHRDRMVIAGAIEELTELGLIAPPATPGPWVLTEAGRRLADDYGWS